jgi:hypothetical protein
VSVVLVALAAGAGLAASAQAATYTVGTTSDLTGSCQEPNSGTCSLRQLIGYENGLTTAPSPPDVIVVPSGKYELTSGTLRIKQPLVILGAGARTTTVDMPSDAYPEPERVFEIETPAESAAGIFGLEIAGGVANADELDGEFGGDIRNNGSLFLSEDWITEGTASEGAGIANFAGTLVLERSLVSDNHASTGSAEGGGILNYGTGTNCDGTCSPGTKAVLAIENTTVADNDASLGAGIFSLAEGGAADENGVSIIDSTIAYNKTQEEPCIECFARGPGAGLLATDGTIAVEGSILAYNSETPKGEATYYTNCSAESPATIVSPLGYNLETGTDCPFTSTGDLQNTAPDFSSTEPQDNGGNTNTLAPELESPAVDAIPTTDTVLCTGADQRDVARPQGAGCDIGAVELGGPETPPPPPPPPPAPPSPAPPSLSATSSPTVLTTTSAAFTTTVNPEGLATTVHFEYGPVLGGASAASTAAIAYGSATPDQSVGAGFANQTVSATVTGLLPNVTYNVRAVATNSAGTALGANQTLVTPADPPPPPPVLGKSVNVTPVSGIVYIELPPGATLSSVSPFSPFALGAQAVQALAKGQSFIPLTEARQIPVGSTLETTHGVVGLTTATTASRKGKLQTGDFEAGIFKLLQGRRQKGLTELDIIDNFSAHQLCATRGKARIASSHPSSKVLGRLTATAHGRFTTRGQYSAATVRGTSWGVLNRCDGTLTRVKRGVVSVRDFRRRKTITLFTGESYLARAPR